MNSLQSSAKLSPTIDVGQYKLLEQKKDREAIARFIQERFSARYIDPVSSGNKHGFTMIAISCLMIEALESFRHGWADTKGKSRKAFHSFFDRHEAFQIFRNRADDFYYGVRCGILHQAETTRGWRIKRSGLLFEDTNKTINATAFLSRLSACLVEYCEQLRRESWDSEIWNNLREKMQAICSNCRFEERPI
jgi:hypothetical protein